MITGEHAACGPRKHAVWEVDRTMSQKLIIDGYNVIHTDEKLRRTACRDLQRARNGLVDRLERYLRGRQLQITLVFDGRGGITEAETVVAGKLQVVYSAGSQTADEVIVSTLQSSDNPAAYVVVTSDMADIGNTARGLGCEVVGSKRFLERIRSATGEKVREVDDNGDPVRGMGDTNYWLDKFTGDAEDDA